MLPAKSDLEIELSKVQPTSSSYCEICGEEVAKPSFLSRVFGEFNFYKKIFGEPNVVECPRCDARYHKDCLEYNGKCATYGCDTSLDLILEGEKIISCKNKMEISQIIYFIGCASGISLIGISNVPGTSPLASMAMYLSGLFLQFGCGFGSIVDSIRRGTEINELTVSLEHKMNQLPSNLNKTPQLLKPKCNTA
ncbi:hypothetical protein KY330_04235 [Candidatus Woesearchaeota archaeon]|nr:hypothetical protein [Candidatus Woesearchaeota archaeon]